MGSTGDLPKSMKALVLRDQKEGPQLETISTPQATLGSAVVQMLAANVLSYMKYIYNGDRNYPYPMPLTIGSSGVARVAAVGLDATRFKSGDLVFVDITIRSRDNPADVCLAAIHDGFTPGSQKLMKDVFRDWTYAEYANVPLENLTLLNENRLTGNPKDGGLSFKIEQVAFMSGMMVPYGGLRDIELRAGQTVVVAPATGPFGGAAVLVAQAMGARVIAMGRNKDSLAFLKKRVPRPELLETVPITGDMMADCNELKKHGQIDAYYDIGPPEAHASTHIKSCILALRHGARVSLMGGYREGKNTSLLTILLTNSIADIAIPHMAIVHKNIRLYGKWMFERSDIADLVQLVESGMLDLGMVDVIGAYPLEQWKEAFDKAEGRAGFGQIVTIKP